MAPWDTRIPTFTPVSPHRRAGVKPGHLVEQGWPGRIAGFTGVDGLILNTPFVGPMSLGGTRWPLFREKLAT